MRPPQPDLDAVEEQSSLSWEKPKKKVHPTVMAFAGGS